MAEPVRPSPVKLDPAATQKLKDLAPDLERAYKEIATMKKLGMDTKDLEEKLAWAADARKTLIDNFGS